MVYFVYGYDKIVFEDKVLEVLIFLFNFVNGVVDYKDELDILIFSYLKLGWSLECLILVDKFFLCLGFYEIKYFDEMFDCVVLNEIIEIVKKYLDEMLVKFVNGLLS